MLYYFDSNQERMFASMPSQPQSGVEAMSLEQARAIVDDLIVRGEKLFATPADETKPLPKQLGPITRDFFSRYGTLKTRRGGFKLSAAGIRASEYVHGFLSIGHSEDWDIVQRQGADEVFVVEGAESCEAEMETCFPSIYHLVVDETLQA
jgi:hypothetical protein